MIFHSILMSTSQMYAKNGAEIERFHLPNAECSASDGKDKTVWNK